MRTQLYLSDIFNRDISWITQEMCEEYAIERRKGEYAILASLDKLSRGNKMRANLFRDVVESHPDIGKLGSEIIEEMGGPEAVFGELKSEFELCKQLENDIAECKNAADKAKLWAQYLAVRGMLKKPLEKPVSIVINNSNEATAVLYSTDPKEAERIAMSIFN